MRGQFTRRRTCLVGLTTSLFVVAWTAGAVPAEAVPAHGATPERIGISIRVDSLPSGCLAALRNQVVAAHQAEILDSGPSAVTLAPQVRLQASHCVQHSSVATLPTTELLPLARLAFWSGADPLGESAIVRWLAQPDSNVFSRAERLADVVAAEIDPSQGTLVERPSPARIAMALRHLQQLDALGDSALMSRIQARSNFLEGAYRNDWRDTTTLQVARDVVRLLIGQSDTSAIRRIERWPLGQAYAVLARQLYVDGQSRALRALLDSATIAVRGPAGDDYVRRVVDNMLRHDVLVGHPAARLVAQRWFNVPKHATPTYPVTGHPTLIMFSSHWCGPCHASYPTIMELQRRYAPHGLQVVLATQTLGAYPDDPDPRAREIAEDEHYYVHDIGWTAPVALYVNPPGPIDPHHLNPNDRSYRVTGLPQYVLIDRHGVIRDVGYGWDAWVEQRVRHEVAAITQ